MDKKENKYKINVQCKNDIKSEISKILKLEQFTIAYYDKMFDEYCVATQLNDLPDFCQLQVTNTAR